jgi:hypothetical protein
MNDKEMQVLVNAILAAIEKLIPLYMKVAEDKNISNGNVAVCIIDESGMV